MHKGREARQEKAARLTLCSNIRCKRRRLVHGTSPLQKWLYMKGLITPAPYNNWESSIPSRYWRLYSASCRYCGIVSRRETRSDLLDISICGRVFLSSNTRFYLAMIRRSEAKCLRLVVSFTGVSCSYHVVVVTLSERVVTIQTLITRTFSLQAYQRRITRLVKHSSCVLFQFRKWRTSRTS